MTRTIDKPKGVTIPTITAFALETDKLKTVFKVNEEPDELRLGKAQFCYICAVVQLGEFKAYNDHIQRFLRDTYGKEFHAGQLSGLAKTLEKKGLIVGRKGGSPSGQGRPITLFKITPAGEAALRHTYDYLLWKSEHSMRDVTTVHHGDERPHDPHFKKPTA